MVHIYCAFITYLQLPYGQSTNLDIEESLTSTRQKSEEEDQGIRPNDT